MDERIDMDAVPAVHCAQTAGTVLSRHRPLFADRDLVAIVECELPFSPLDYAEEVALPREAFGATFHQIDKGERVPGELVHEKGDARLGVRRDGGQLRLELNRLKRRVHAAVNTLGNLLALKVTAPNEQERAQVEELAA